MINTPHQSPPCGFTLLQCNVINKSYSVLSLGIVQANFKLAVQVDGVDRVKKGVGEKNAVRNPDK